MSRRQFTIKDLAILSLIMLCIGFGAGFSVSLLKVVVHKNEIREFNAEYQFISPLIACREQDEALSNEQIKTYEKKVTQLIEALRSHGSLNAAAVYFRELDGGSWFGINQDAVFTPGSLLKVPLVMSIYKHAESDPLFLNRTGVYVGPSLLSRYTPHFVPSASITPDTEYTVSDLIEATLVRSDNNAAVLLGNLLPLNEIISSYTHLGIESPESGQDARMSVRTYASFFRILYNASYIPRLYSEKMLQLLSESEFKEGIVAGVPSDVTVSHKFGEREASEGGNLQLHDCGVVYHDPNPYVLCVMTRGDDFDELAESIKEISALVYKEVDASK